ncbi:unnamed protein product, partial [Darwinula stevensoni]
MIHPSFPGDSRLTSNDSEDPSEGGITKRIIVPLFPVQRRCCNFFVEAGALDGRRNSKTLHLEETYKWTGLLVEPNPHLFHKMTRQKRNAWLAPYCLSPTDEIKQARVVGVSLRPKLFDCLWGKCEQQRRENEGSGEGQAHQLRGRGQVLSSSHALGCFGHPDCPFLQRGLGARRTAGSGKGRPTNYVAVVRCYPLRMLLDALGIRTVHFFSVDLERVELQALKTLPFHRIEFQVIQVKCMLDEGVEGILKEFLLSLGSYSDCVCEPPKDRLGMVPPPLEADSRLTSRDGEDPSEGGITKRIIAPLFPFQNRHNKFFVEAGALDGRTISKTFHLEESYGWTGLLAEPRPHLYNKMTTRKRNAWLAPYCLSPEDAVLQEVMEYPYDPNDPIGPWRREVSIERNGKGPMKNGTTIYSALVKCYPLHMLLDALDIRTVHFFSLDVEGLELQVLKTLPFHRINFQVIQVKYPFADERKKPLKEFLLSLGYKLVCDEHGEFVFANMTASVLMANFQKFSTHLLSYYSCVVVLVIVLSFHLFTSTSNTRCVYYPSKDALGMIPPALEGNASLPSSDGEDPSEGGITKRIIAPLFPVQNRYSKFFVEAGALDGKTISKTLYLEEAYGWTGLLLEPNPHLFQKMTMQGRNAWLGPYCLSPDVTIIHDVMEYPYDPNDPIASWGGGISKKGKVKGPVKDGTTIYSALVKCYPLHMLLDALDIKTVHFFSLDVEGLELQNRYSKFFVEAGALDGKTISKTLYLEEAYGWTGLLLEPNPHLFQKMTMQGRNAWLGPYCLSPDVTIIHDVMEYPYDPNDPIASWGGGISKKGKVKGPVKDGTTIYSALVKCYPLHMLLDALDIKT